MASVLKGQEEINAFAENLDKWGMDPSIKTLYLIDTNKGEFLVFDAYNENQAKEVLKLKYPDAKVKKVYSEDKGDPSVEKEQKDDPSVEKEQKDDLASYVTDKSVPKEAELPAKREKVSEMTISGILNI